MTTVDAHHHFWDPGRADYPWLTDELASIRRPFGPNDLRPVLAAEAIDRTVLVQTRSSVEETEEFLVTAADEEFIAGVVGWVDLTDPGVAEQIARLRDLKGGGRLVGIRHQAHDEPDPEWLIRADVMRGLHAVEQAGLVFDLLVRTRELPAALSVASTLPGLRFVVDHIAKPPIASGALEPWAGRLRPLGERPNVMCKVSGMVTEADLSTWTTDDLRPYVDVVLEVFGPDRLMFGSDWPVCLLAATYAQVVDATRELLGDLSAAERRMIFGGTAAKTYALEVAQAVGEPYGLGEPSRPDTA
ncbi:MAG TPA: amidohydrolase family protein [Candidatus Limnocylindrales bacterium]|jgi:L-fuconolactonase